MSGVILSLLLNYGILTSPRPVEAMLLGGYYVGPFYATVSAATMMTEAYFAWGYYPKSIDYDFRVGFRKWGFDFGLSRWCIHEVSRSGTHESWDLSFFFQWSNWDGD